MLPSLNIGLYYFILLSNCSLSLVQGRRVDVAKVCVLYKLLVIDAGEAIQRLQLHDRL